MTYTKTRRVDGDFEEVLELVRGALEAEGFGVLTDVDVQLALEEKLGVSSDFRYRILGACDPRLAEQGLKADPDLGALLPCNVAVYEPPDGDGVVVSAVDPKVLLDVADGSELELVADDVAERFDRVLAQVAYVR